MQPLLAPRPEAREPKQRTLRAESQKEKTGGDKEVRGHWRGLREKLERAKELTG